jgi:hypothetical protein
VRSTIQGRRARTAGRSLLLASAAFAALAPQASSAQEITLLRPGLYFSDDRPKDLSGNWLCMSREPERIELHPCSPKLVPVEQQIHDEMLLRVEPERETRETLFAIRGWSPPRDASPFTTYRALPMWFRIGEMPIESPGRASLLMEKSSEGVCIRLRSEGREQTIACLDTLDEDATALHWAGDLDGDGRIDLLVDATSHHAGTDLRLYLSSRASNGELVREVARLEKSNC